MWLVYLKMLKVRVCVCVLAGLKGGAMRCAAAMSIVDAAGVVDVIGVIGVVVYVQIVYLFGGCGIGMDDGLGRGFWRRGCVRVVGGFGEMMDEVD